MYIGLAGLMASAAAADADELIDKLNAISGLTVVAELPTDPGARFFRLTYEQPVDHLQPWKGSFTQRASLYHRSESAPTVFYSFGYYYSGFAGRVELARMVDGNEVDIEHRFFKPSVPDPADWSDLSIFQEAADDHRLLQALRSIYPGRWLRTGGSKGGMQAVYHERFFPGDIDGLVAYSAPDDVIDSHDSYAWFLAHVGTDPQCRANLTALQRQALIRRDDLVAMMIDSMGEGLGPWEHTYGSPDRALEILVLEMPFTFWQYYGQAACSTLPPADASTQDLFDFLDQVQGFFFFTDIGTLDLEPYFYQAGTQLGYPDVGTAELADLLRYPGIDTPRSFVSPEIPMGPFQWWAMPDVDLFVRLFGKRQMFIYGQNDPWGAERFQAGPFSVETYVYDVAGGTHNATIAKLSEADRAAATATVFRWAGLPPPSAEQLAALRTPVSGRLDRDELDRSRRPRPNGN
jgi:hypothetical protein